MKTKAMVIVGSLVVGVLVVLGAFLFSGGDDEPESPAAPAAQSPRPVTMAELTEADGQDGQPCYVAVDGTVYEISDSFLLWEGGEHEPSAGQAYCGADMSEAIRQAPHGTSKLDLLVVIGPLQP